MTSAGVVLGGMESVRTSIKPHRPHPSHTPRGASRLTSPQVTALRADFAGALGADPLRALTGDGSLGQPIAKLDLELRPVQARLTFRLRDEELAALLLESIRCLLR